MLRRSNKRKNQPDNSIANTSLGSAPSAPTEKSSSIENTMSEEAFIQHNEDAKKVYEDIMNLRKSVENLKSTVTEGLPEGIANARDEVHVKESQDVVAAKRAVVEQAKRDFLVEKEKREEAIRREQELMAQQQRAMEAQRRVALIEEEAERKRKEAEEAERRAKAEVRKLALEAMEAKRRVVEQSAQESIVEQYTQESKKESFREDAQQKTIDKELEIAKEQLIAAQKQQEAKLEKISYSAEVNTEILASEQQEKLGKQEAFIKTKQAEVAEIIESNKELRRRKIQETKRLKQDAKKIRIREKKEERLRKLEERELIKKAKKDAEARLKLEQMRREAKSRADAELGGGIVNVQGVSINTEITDTLQISFKDLLNIRNKSEKKAESKAERRKLERERKIRTEEAREAIDAAVRKRARKYEKTAFAQGFKRFKSFCDRHKVALLTSFAIILALIVTAAGVLNYYTAYAYSYNGKELGVVKEKDDVLRITDLVQNALTEDKSVEVVIDAKDDISFNRVATIGDVEIDSSEDVLKKLTYMGDLNVKAYGIFINGKKVGAVGSKEAAANVLQTIKDGYGSNMDGAKIEEAVFIESVDVNKSNTDLEDVLTEEEMVELLRADQKTESLHEVVAGETLEDVAKLYSVTEEQLLKDNPSVTAKNLKVGTKLVIKKEAPILTVKITEKVTYEQVVEHKVQEKDSEDIYEGYTEVEQEGEDGLSEITSRIVLVNGEKVDETALVTTVKKKPVKEIVLVGVKERPPSVGSGKYIWPMKSGYTFTSGFKMRWGRLHAGIDLATPTGNDVLAADGGIVTYAGYSGAYGYLIKIDHQNGMETRYAHNSKLLVSEGDEVFQGMHIAESGNTGRSTGAHLHFEIRVNGVPKNPMNYLP